MNLAKLFNFKYFIQNIKKSKMAIILFLSVVPIFTALTIITTASNGTMLEFYELGLANIIFMYITPFVLSFALFGYVYKKKNIDFMCSMPISRKSIFVTNTIGGIILLVLSQLITFLISMLIGALTDGIIFTNMLLDIFLYQSIAYIFVFAVSNLAMTVSGNLLTQIVVTLLILFIIPVSVFYFDLWNGNNYDLVDGYYNINSYYRINGIRDYTAPSMPFALTNSGAEYGFNSISILKMVILSLIYIVLGYIFFERKKMESAGESFENKYVHFIVKGLTIIPFAMILVALADSDEWEAILFIVAIIAVYYFIYDLVTNKKNKVIQNLLALAASILILCGVYGVIANISEDINLGIKLADIKSIIVQDINYRLNGLNYEITDKDMIEKIIYDSARDKEYNQGERVELLLNMSNGSKKSYRPYISTDIIEVMLKSANSERFEVGEVKYEDRVELTKNERKNLRNALNNIVREKGISNLYRTLRSDNYDSYYIYGYKYENHRIRKITYPINASEEIFNIVTIAENRNTAEYVRKRESYSLYLSISIDKDFNYYSTCPEEIKAYIIANKDKACNMNEEYIVMNIAGNKFFTNDIENVINIIKNSKEYDEYMNNDYKYYYDDLYYNEIYDTETSIEVIPNTTETI